MFDACQSDMRGLATAGRDFESEWIAGLVNERHPLHGNKIAHSDFRGSLRNACWHRSVLTWTFGSRQSSMTANDQHQPASSRAIAALATTGRLRRSSKRSQRACKRRLAVWPRVRAAGEAAFQRRRMTSPGR